jgi:rare lipoprotein A
VREGNAASDASTGTAASIPRSERGLATWYGEPYHGRRTASGEVFDTYGELTAAHRTLPFNTIVKVTNEVNGREVEVRINDRGPFTKGRVIDLSLKAARQIDMVRAGTVPVTLTLVREGTPTARRIEDSSSSATIVYTVQVAAFETQDAAETLQRNLERRYRDVIVQKFSSNRTFYRVRVGRLSDRSSAEELAKQLREEEKFDPFVVRLN